MVFIMQVQQDQLTFRVNLMFLKEQVYVTNGNENSPAPYVLITNNPIFLNVSDITFKLSNFVFVKHQDLVLLEHLDQESKSGSAVLADLLVLTDQVVVQDLAD
jgi:hypothetical protein